MTPKGWKLVPTEPQVEMLAAWYRTKNGHHFHDEPPPTDTSDFAAYRAMLAASPPPPVEWSDEVRLALLKAEQAIVDWGNLYAPDECYEETVAAAKERIREAGGTLGYLADALGSIRAALTAIGAKDAD